VPHLNALSVSGMPGVADVGLGSSSGTTSGSPGAILAPASPTGGRDVVAAVAGSLADIELFEGQIHISVAEAPIL
jgi:hypothetical protein